jgi:hypothetical protein
MHESVRRITLVLSRGDQLVARGQSQCVDSPAALSDLFLIDQALK